jgi:hypothetical protein
MYLAYFNAGLQIYDVGDPVLHSLMPSTIPDDPERA